ncbi:MAG: UDP-N-acetylmuramate--L-alanine ligase [Bacteroidota bacterium]
MFSSIKKIHFVGIGGIGMSGMAEILIDQGFKITGSDKSLSEVTDRLTQIGAKIFEGHDAKNIEDDVDTLVYSSAVVSDNPEVREAVKRKIPIVRRAEMLAEMIRLKYGIAIAGTHGKTTTTSMVSLILIEGGVDPTVIVGGKLSGLGGTNARLGHGEFIVVEADEYDRSFLSLTPTIAVLTTLEVDHLDCYRDLDDIKNAFVQFANKVPFYGFIVLCLDEPALQEIMPQLSKKIILTYGLSPQADVQAVDINFKNNESSFTVICKQKELGRITLQSPGNHNIQNSLAAITVALELKIPFEKIKSGIEKFSGVYRRWEKKGEVNGISLYDDYAHHPTECRATLSGAKSGWRKRIVCVFQPHLFTRTRDFYEEFGKAFLLADILIVTDVYPAREEPIQGITGELIVNAAKEFGHKNANYLKDKKDVPNFLNTICKEGDIVITMGAGDIWKFGEEYLKTTKK